MTIKSIVVHPKGATHKDTIGYFCKQSDGGWMYWCSFAKGWYTEILCSMAYTPLRQTLMVIPMTPKNKVVPLGTTHYEFDSPTRGAGYMKLHKYPIYVEGIGNEVDWFFWSNEMNEWVLDNEAEQRQIYTMFRPIEHF